MTVDFRLAGQEYIGLNGGPMFHFSEAVSLSVDCGTQEVVDRFWDRLTEGGEESMCGWLKDRYGLSWQIVPRALPELLADPDKDRAERVMKAMLGMRKLDIRTLRDA
ncbi:VOC family protein [Streptomyces sp. NBC_00887]|uniref:VOC family protein n=1 Tax=Streptomyces sp. NBC_00887 TaxID=2975859 RepID=UPI003867557A